jgi:hypothetical protein
MQRQLSSPRNSMTRKIWPHTLTHTHTRRDRLSRMSVCTKLKASCMGVMVERRGELSPPCSIGERWVSWERISVGKSVMMIFLGQLSRRRLLHPWEKSYQVKWQNCCATRPQIYSREKLGPFNTRTAYAALCEFAVVRKVRNQDPGATFSGRFG